MFFKKTVFALFVVALLTALPARASTIYIYNPRPETLVDTILNTASHYWQYHVSWVPRKLTASTVDGDEFRFSFMLSPNRYFICTLSVVRRGDSAPRVMFFTDKGCDGVSDKAFGFKFTSTPSQNLRVFVPEKSYVHFLSRLVVILQGKALVSVK